MKTRRNGATLTDASPESAPANTTRVNPIIAMRAE
jgi:hypothetical protein